MVDSRPGVSHDEAVIRVLVVSAVASVVVGCTGTQSSSCDPSALAAITATLEREVANAGAELRAIEALAAACPGLHPGFVRALRSEHVYERAESLAVPEGLPEAKMRVCADPDGWVRDVPAAPAELRADILFDRCGFARLGVLDEGEELLVDDIDVLFVLATLERDGVERALLRRLGRALMISVAPLPVASRRCIAAPYFGACARLLRVAGIEPAPASANRPGLRTSPRLLLSPGALRWDGETIAADVEEHRIAALAAAVAAWAAELDEHARELLLAPDRGLAFGTLIDALYTIARAGIGEIVVVGQARYGLVSIPVSSPLAWLAASGETQDPPGLPVVTIDESMVSVTLGSGETTRLRLDDGAAITAFAAGAANRYKRGVVHVRATRATRVEAVIAVLDALRGPDCRHPDDAAECLLSRPMLDQEPAIAGENAPAAVAGGSG